MHTPDRLAAVPAAFDRVRRLAGMLFTVLLAACATVDSCPLVPLAQTPLDTRGNLMFVAAGINGRPVRFLVDTGAERTVLTETAVARLGLPHDPQHVSRTIGIGGISANRDALVPGIVMGGTRFPLDRVAVGHFVFDHVPGPQVDGLLGADILLAFDMDIDQAAHQLTLYRVRRCPDAKPPWTEPSVQIEGVGARRDRLLVPIVLDGEPGMAVLDTGAQASTVDMALVKRLGLSADTLKFDRSVMVHGASPQAIPVRVHRFRELRVGPAVIDEPDLAIVPAGVGASDALIGGDFLRGRHIWLSFATRRLFVTERLPPIGGAVSR